MQRKWRLLCLGIVPLMVTLLGCEDTGIGTVEVKLALASVVHGDGSCQRTVSIGVPSKARPAIGKLSTDAQAAGWVANRRDDGSTYWLELSKHFTDVSSIARAQNPLDYAWGPRCALQCTEVGVLRKTRYWTYTERTNAQALLWPLYRYAPTEECSACGGDGRHERSISVPTGQYGICPRCMGVGKNLCSSCGGDGIARSWLPHWDVKVCWWCEGVGTLPCSRCWGDGIWEPTDQRTYTEACSKCGGWGAVVKNIQLDYPVKLTVSLPEHTPPTETVPPGKQGAWPVVFLFASGQFQECPEITLRGEEHYLTSLGVGCGIAAGVILLVATACGCLAIRRRRARRESVRSAMGRFAEERAAGIREDRRPG